MNFAITLAPDDTVIGSIGLEIRHEHHLARLGYWLGVPYWNLGYATEAVKAVLAFGFSTPNLYRLYTPHRHDNPASGRVLQKAGCANTTSASAVASTRNCTACSNQSGNDADQPRSSRLPLTGNGRERNGCERTGADASTIGRSNGELPTGGSNDPTTMPTMATRNPTNCGGHTESAEPKNSHPIQVVRPATIAQRAPWVVALDQ